MIVDRREFAAGVLCAAMSPTLLRAAAPPASVAGGPSLIPTQRSGAPNYFCTWAVQNYVYGDGERELDIGLLQGDSGAQLARRAMDEERLFGSAGWASKFYPKVRQDLYFLLDDGWESAGMSSFELDPVKFSKFRGSAEERLRLLEQRIVDMGWRGSALWCRNPPGGTQGRELLQRSARAGVQYWKIDIGDPDFALTRIRNSDRLPLALEHVRGELPVNGNWHQDGRFGKQSWDSPRMQIFRNTDVYRTYDVTAILSLPTTLDRVAEIMQAAQGHPEVKTLLNVEDEVYVAAVLGCTAGVMRHPRVGLRSGKDVDLFFNGPRQTKYRMDEVIRAMRWQRIAPPFAPGENVVRVDDTILTDNWMFRSDETWQKDVIGHTVRQGAPARIALNLPLPIVRSSKEAPFVFAARFPNGAVAIGAQQRTEIGRAWFMPEADVLLECEEACGPFGIFGHFDKLTLRLSNSLDGRRILAQDLAGEHSFDITNEVKAQGHELTLQGDVITKYGLEASSKDDLSSPGLLLQIS